MSTMISANRGMKARRVKTRYNSSTMASAPCPYFVKVGYCKDHTKEAEVRAKVVAAKEAEIIKEANKVVDEYLEAMAQNAEHGASTTSTAAKNEYMIKIVRDLKKEKKYADWNLEMAVQDEMRKHKLHHCPFAHHRELLRNLNTEVAGTAMRGQRLLAHHAITAFSSLNSNDDLLHATLEHILSFDKNFEVPEDILLSLEPKIDQEEEDDQVEDEGPLDINAFQAEMIKMRPPLSFLEKVAFTDIVNKSQPDQPPQLIVPISLCIAHLPALVEYYAPMVLAKHNEKKKAKRDRRKVKDGKASTEDALLEVPQFVVTAKQINFSDAFFVQNFFALVAHVSRTRWANEVEIRSKRLPLNLSLPNGDQSPAVFPFRMLSLQYCDIINAEELFSAIRKDAFHRVNLRAVDLSHNKLDSLKFLFQLRAFFSTTSSASSNSSVIAAGNGASPVAPSTSQGGRIVSLWLAHNPITRKPDYRKQIQLTLPALLMLDGTRLRKLPLALPFPVASRWNFPQTKAASAHRAHQLFGAYGPSFDPVMSGGVAPSTSTADKKKGKLPTVATTNAAGEELTEEEIERNARLKKTWAEVAAKVAKECVKAGTAPPTEMPKATNTPPPRPNPRFQIANGKEYDAVTSFVYRYLFYWEKGEVPFSVFQHQHLLSMTTNLQQLVEEEAERDIALAKKVTKKAKADKKAAKESEQSGKAKPTDDDEEELETETEEYKRLQYAKKLSILSAGPKPNVDSMINDGLVSHLDTELYSLEGLKEGSEEAAIFARYLNMVPAAQLAAEQAAESTSARSLGLKAKSTPMQSIVDISYENFATKFLHPSATVSVTVSPSCHWFDQTKMFNKSEVMTSHNHLNVLDAKLLWRLTGESTALRNYFYTPPPMIADKAISSDEDGDSVNEDEDGDLPSSSSEEDVGEAPTLQNRLSTYQVSFARSRYRKRGRGGRRKGGAIANQASRGKIVLQSGNNDQAGLLPSHVPGSNAGGYIPGAKSAAAAAMTVSRDFLRQIMLLSAMDMQDLRLLDTAAKSHSRNLLESFHQEVRHRIARGPMNAFNLYRSTVYPLGSINASLQSTGAVAFTDATTTLAGRKVRAHLMEKMRVPDGRSGGINVMHHLQHVPTMSVQVITDQVHEVRQRDKDSRGEAQSQATTGAPQPFGNLQKDSFAPHQQQQAVVSLTDEEIDALRYNAKGQKISDAALKIKALMALKEKQTKAKEEEEANKPAVVFQNIADPKDRKRSRSGGAAPPVEDKKSGKTGAALPTVKLTAAQNQQLFGVPLQDQSKPPFYLVTLHGVMTWRTPTMASQPLLPAAALEDLMSESSASAHNSSGRKPTDVLSFAFPNGISCFCDRTLTVTAQRIEVSLPLKTNDHHAAYEQRQFGSDGEEIFSPEGVRALQHVPPFIAALARERLAALSYVDAPPNYYAKKEKSKKDISGIEPNAKSSRSESGRVATDAFGPVRQEHLTLYVKKLFIYNDQINLRPSGLDNGFVTAAATSSGASTGRYHAVDSASRRHGQVSDQSGNVVYTHLRVDKMDELELEHCGGGLVNENDEEVEVNQAASEPTQPTLSSRQFIQQVLERSESDRAVYEALREAFGAALHDPSNEDEATTTSEPVSKDTIGIQTLLRRHSSLGEK